MLIIRARVLLRVPFLSVWVLKGLLSHRNNGRSISKVVNISSSSHFGKRCLHMLIILHMIYVM